MTALFVPIIIFLAGCSLWSLKPELRRPASSELTPANRMASNVQTLVGFYNRNACATSADDGVNLAAKWIKETYQNIPNLMVSEDEFTMSNCGLSSKIKQHNIIASLRGSDISDEIVLLGGHYDSRALLDTSSSAYAPGANDSGSQTAVLLEAARILAGKKYRRTIIFVSFSGEEQGLIGSAHLVESVGTIFPGKKIVAMLNFDIVGGDSTVNDTESLNRFRLYVPNQEPHLTLAKQLRQLNETLDPEFKMDIYFTADRVGRAGDQISFQNKGIPAVRFIEARENLSHQHSKLDVMDYVTPTYMAKMANLAEILTASIAEPVTP